MIPALPETEVSAQAGAPMRAANGLAGDAATPAALSRLSRNLARSKAAKADRKRSEAVVTKLKAAVARMRMHDFKGASDRALEALKLDERSGVAWHVLAISREKAGDPAQAITAYEAALKLSPNETDIAHDLGRLAQRLGYLEIAEKLLVRYLADNPGHIEATNNLACVLREAGRYGEAIDLLRDLLQFQPTSPILWNTVGTVMSDQGESATALTFFEEALRLDPGFVKARYNRGNARAPLGDREGALEDLEAARQGADPGFDAATMDMARALLLLSMGRIEQGFDAYQVRLDPTLPDAMHVLLDAPRWKTGDPLEGRRILVVGEQGLADEVLLGTALPDLIRAVGPSGQIYLAVEKRLVEMFQRTFPEIIVGAHRAGRRAGRLVRFMPFMQAHAPVDGWMPMGEPSALFRRRVEDFPGQAGYLKADPAKVAYWKAELDALGPELKVGLHWKSLVLRGARARYFSAFERWKPVLTAPGCRMINLQCGDTAEDLAAVRAAGVDIWTPPINLKDDLEDLAALSLALDVVIGPGIAGTNLAAGVGAETWMITAPDDWHLLGTGGYPFYPQMRCFPTAGFGGWDPALKAVADDLARLAPGQERREHRLVAAR